MTMVSRWSYRKGRVSVDFKAILVMALAFIAYTKAEGAIVSYFPSLQKDNDSCTGSGLGHYSRLTLDEDTGKLYLGGVNRIFQLDSTLKVEACVITGPKEDSPQCHASGCNSPDIQTTVMDNWSKILILDKESGCLIACGSLFQGACNKYDISNISSRAQFFPINIAANDQQSSTFAFIGPEHYNLWEKSNVLYVGTTFTNNGEYRHDVPAIASRNLNTLDIAENSYSKQSLLKIDVKYRDHFLVKYVYGFNSSDYAYFILVQKQSHLPGQEEKGYVTRIARVCINDNNYDSYTEVTFQCLVKNPNEKMISNYNLIQDVKLIAAGEELAVSLGIKPGSLILVGSFSPSRGIGNDPHTHSALCVYTMMDIDTKFNENVKMCINGSVKYRNMPYVSGLILDGNCPAPGTTGNGAVNFCEVGLKISGTVPISSEALVTFPNNLITSVALSLSERNTVAFLGTSTGELIKVLIMSSTEAIEYERLTVDAGNPILPDTVFSPTAEHIYVLTNAKVSKVSVEHCGTYTNCSTCLESMDPYCGWCSLERRCTVRSACQKASHSSPRWLSHGTGHPCIDFEQVVPDCIPVNKITAVQLSIRTLPELPYGAKYRCVFGGAEPIDAEVNSSGLSCATPPVSSRPVIPEGKDHINVPLSVRSSETNKDFVSRNFAYFDCGAHTRCLDCVKSQWACNWCIYENKCTHESLGCRTVISGESNPSRTQQHGRESCPRIRRPMKPILLPNRVSREIELEVENMPHPLPSHTGFSCIVVLEEAKMMVPAVVQKHRFVVCDRTLYNYENKTGTNEAPVTVVWNRNHYIDTITVTIYKCDILGSHRQHPDCSLCVTRNEMYHCAWCDNTCAYTDQCSLPSVLECPKPRIDMIKPLSGPIEGGTLVTIEGSNLGLREEDVKDKIRIGDIPCELIDYEVSVRIVCRTGNSSVKKVASVMIGNSAGFTESSVHFSYENIEVTGVTPSKGPRSGGTQLAITGKYLNIGSRTSAFLDELPCYVNATQATSTRITCITSSSTVPRVVRKLTLAIDGANRTLSNSPFAYKQDPTIVEIKPLKSFISGGRMITVHGTNLDTVQKPEMIVYADTNIAYPVNKTDCLVLNSYQMECPSPTVNQQYHNDGMGKRRRRSGRNSEQYYLTYKVGFLMDNVESVNDLEKHYKGLPNQLVYVEDPFFEPFPNDLKIYRGDTLVIEGQSLNLACDESDVSVTIGTASCNVTYLANTQLVCTPPQTQPTPSDDKDQSTSTKLPLVVVHVGRNLRFPIGYIQYEMAVGYTFPSEAMAALVIAVIFIFIFFGVILGFFRQKSSQAEREYKRIQIQMDTLESNVRMECKQAFAELQTDMTDLTADLGSAGIPVLDRNEYVLKVFFPGVKDHPVLTDPKVRMTCPPTSYDAAMMQFEQLIANKHFLLTFIDTLEAQPSFGIRDRVNVASLLMVVLMGRMEYATEIMKSLLLRLIDKCVASKHPHMMLRRTESVVEKMLTNWLALCMYQYLKDTAGPSLFLLYKAIKHQIEKGPVDALTHQARYSLSEERLLREQVDHNAITLNVVQDDSEEKLQCRVLDCDTITQVKIKILDALYKNAAFTTAPTIDDVDLEWRHGRGGRVTLRDDDITTKTMCGWKKLNTLAHYGVRDSAVMSLIPANTGNFPTSSSNSSFLNSLSSLMPASNGSTDSANNSPLHYHLVKPSEDGNYYANNSSEHTHKAIPEIFLTRLLSTKGTVQKFVDDFFNTILTANESLPIAIKWLFDLYDEAAREYNILDPEVLHAWKSNSIPLRFWVNFIKNPDFIFDIMKTPTIDSSLSVIAQTFMDACSTSNHRLGKDSPSNKLLFAKDIPQYREAVLRYYYDIQQLPPVSDEELRRTMQYLSTMQMGHLHVISAFKELYIYVSKYNVEIMESLEVDPFCQGTQLIHRLEGIAYTLQGEQTSSC